MPATYMADCVVMTHAVLRQLESYGSSGDRVSRFSLDFLFAESLRSL